MEQKGIIGSLTSLRFFAAFAILLHHSRDLVLPGDFLEGVPLALGVSFFFVLSGFILAYVYSGRMESVGVYGFYTSRISRIWPVHILTMVVVVVLYPPSGLTQGAQHGWLVTLLNVFLLQSIVPMPAYYFSFNGVSWSISSELFFYAAFPFLLKGLSGNWHFKLLGLLLLGGLSVYLFDCYGSGYYSSGRLTEFSGHGISYISPLCRIQEFFIGVLLFNLFNYIKGWRIFGVAFCTILEVLCIGSVIFFTRRIVDIAYSFAGAGDTAVGEFWGHCATGLFFGFVVLCFAFNRGWVSRLLRIRLFVILGEISFSMYMIHQIIFRCYNARRHWFEFIPQDMVFPLLLLGVCALSYVIWRFFELPAQIFLKALFSKLKRKQGIGDSVGLV